jgi:hypothetical protein
MKKNLTKKGMATNYFFLALFFVGSGMKKKSGSGINIPDPQHCIKGTLCRLKAHTVARNVCPASKAHSGNLDGCTGHKICE